MIWLGIVFLLLCAIGFLLWPWIGQRAPTMARRAHDMAVYQAQLDEVQSELARGTLTDAEAENARLEIKRRLLRADAADAGEAVPGGLTPGIILTTAVFLGLLPVVAVGLYTALGRPDAVTAANITQPADAARGRAEAQEIENLVQRLQQRLQAEPDRADGWLLLGRTLMNLNRFNEAAEAFMRYTQLQPDDAEVQAYLGEALVYGNDGRMVRAARVAFGRALQGDPDHPSARYYLAEAKLQDGDPRGAFNDWLALLQSAPPEAGWASIVRGRLEELAPSLGVPLAGLPAAPSAAAPGPNREQVEAAQAMPAEDREAMIRGMVDRLAQRLQEQPNDGEGWLRLARAREVLKESVLAREAYTRALALLPQDHPQRAEIQAKLAQLGR